jgi:hypothetical protein
MTQPEPEVPSEEIPDIAKKFYEEANHYQRLQMGAGKEAGLIRFHVNKALQRFIAKEFTSMDLMVAVAMQYGAALGSHVHEDADQAVGNHMYMLHVFNDVARAAGLPIPKHDELQEPQVTVTEPDEEPVAEAA